jgi:hypothetical protein
MVSASGFVSSTLRSAGPLRSIDAIRAKILLYQRPRGLAAGLHPLLQIRHRRLVEIE